jgi:hypothetical protein
VATDIVVANAIVGSNILDYASIPAPFQFGSTFTGWAYDSAGTLPVGALDNITDGLTIYAVWELDSVAPTSTVVHTVGTKNIAYTFSEEVQLITGNDLWVGWPGAIIRAPAITHDLFNIYELDEAYAYVLTDGVAVPVTGTAISALTFNALGTVASFTYTGSIPVSASHHYVVDCMGYTITDLAGNEHAVGVASTFDVTA